MIDFDEAVRRVLALATPLGPETVPTARAAGRILAAPVVAGVDSPRTAVSAMDGYAVRTSAAPAFTVIGQSLPGAGFPGTVGEGQAVRIFTGAPVPQGADRVLIQEVIRREGDLGYLDQPLSGPTHIRAQGSDFASGDTLLPVGRRLDARAMVAAGGADLGEIEVFRRPKVVVLGTGDELHEPGTAHLSRFGIAESVSLGVAALAETWGGVPVGRRRITDDLPLLKAAAREALDDADVVVVTGGASVGERDFARAMFEDEALELVFSKVEMKPGKPVWLGRARGRLVLGLPGNPTSAMVTGRLFLAPLLAGLAGDDARRAAAWFFAPLAASLAGAGDRETFYRGRLTAAGLEPLSDQDSGSQKALAQADALIRRRPNDPAVAAGGEVETLRF